MIIPYGIKARDWFCSLTVDFPSENIQIPNNDEDWRIPGDFLGNSLFFSSKGIQSTLKYSTFEEWAIDAYNALN